MSTCQECGGELPVEANFCATCGLPTESARPAGSVDLLVNAADAKRTEGNARHDPRRRVFSCVALGLLLLVGWLTFRSSASEVDGVPDELAEADDAQITDDSEAAADGDAAGEGATDEDQAAEVVEETHPATSEPESLRPGQPMLAEGETGYRLLASDDRYTIDINLDTGEIQRFDEPFEIIGVTDTELVVFDPELGFVALDATNPSESGRVQFSIPEVSAAESRVSVGSLHNAALRLPSTLLAEFDETLNSPRLHDSLVFEINIDSGRFGAVELEGRAELSPLSRSQYGLVWTAGGGLFDVHEGTYRQLSVGVPLLLGVSYAIVQTCVVPGDCSYAWIDRATARPTSERALPDLTGAIWISEIDQAARVLSIRGGRADGLYDVERQQMIPELSSTGTFSDSRFPAAPVALSPDGRWLAYIRHDDAYVRDLESQADYRIDILPDLSESTLTFVPIG